MQILSIETEIIFKKILCCNKFLQKSAHFMTPLEAFDSLKLLLSLLVEIKETSKEMNRICYIILIGTLTIISSCKFFIITENQIAFPCFFCG